MKSTALFFIAALSTCALAAEAPTAPSPKAAAPIAEPFGKTADGTAVNVFTLTNSHGIKLRAMTYGAIVLSLETPDRDGKLADIVLGYNTVDEYIKDTPYFGAIVGRYGNRIANGKFSLNGQDYTLATNNEPGGIKCSLHGGLTGFDKVVWKGEGLLNKDGSQGVKFTYLSKDGEEGYPGNLSLSVTYTLTSKNEWKIQYAATTDKATPINVTQHSYFNLKGEGNGDILGHELMLAAAKTTPVTAGLIPTGKFAPVAGTPFDFTKPTAIGARVTADDEQMKFGGGYDHNWVLDNQSGKLALAAKVYEPTTGRSMEVLTTEPGIQFYCGNFLDGKQTGKSGKKYEFRNGFCLETQHYPDSPNQATFPSVILKPGKALSSTTIYRFSSKKS
ncbi:MAG: galactose mutarotase [Verrucomicrobia bacterium]|nr:MAG: galactose mutarotase [Verrucomicrobiota bacterium]